MLLAMERSVEAFGRDLKAARVDAGLTQADLGERVTVSAAAVGNWERGEDQPGPQTVFALERELGLVPGELSRRLGYVPVGANVSVLASIDGADELTERERKILRTLYRSLRSSEPGP